MSDRPLNARESVQQALDVLDDSDPASREGRAATHLRDALVALDDVDELVDDIRHAARECQERARKAGENDKREKALRQRGQSRGLLVAAQDVEDELGGDR